jgi:hypothetical protein
MKGMISDLVTSQNAKYNTLFTDLAIIQQAIQSIQKDVMQSVTLVLKSGESFTKDLKGKKRCPTHPLAQFSRRRPSGEEAIGQLKIEHSARMKAQRSQFLNSKRTMIAAARHFSNSVLQEINDRVAELYTEYAHIVAEHDRIMRNKKRERTRIISDLSQNTATISHQITALHDDASSRTRSKGKISADLRRHREQQIREFEGRCKRLRRETHEVKKLRRAGARSHTRSASTSDE